MTDMIERVARAICRAGGKDPDETMIEIGGVRTPMWDAFVPIARAAIEAMREPTDQMGAAGLVGETGDALTQAERDAIKWSERLDGNPSKWRKPMWRAMIDAALNHPSEPK